MTKQEWLKKAFDRFKYYGCSDLQARYLADAVFIDTCQSDTSYDPVEAVNEEVSYWS